ncbi:MAG: hypothetical protein KatS3mg027_2159 [Bacteroidia bacterium]|nr:MAG: hypothetical protein KatS3mg027_2159 [Bacteroidia bacterium]
MRVCNLLYSFFLFILVSNLYLAQENKNVSVGININRPKNWDTTYYTSYSHKLNIYLGSSQLSYNFDVSSAYKHPYKYPININYTTNMPTNVSVGFSYDKISFGVGISKKYSYDSTLSKPKTSYDAYNFSFGGNKFIIEPYYVRFKGFYDANTPKNDTLYFKNTRRYHADPSMDIQSIKVNGIYFFNNKKFAYRSLSGFTYRQIKSTGSWLAIANIYYTKMKSDSVIYPKSVELAYDSVEKINQFSVYGLNVGGGYGHTFAFGKKKRFFIGFTAGLMLGYQNRVLYFKDSISVQESKMGSGFDVRLASGWTTDKFFMIVYASADRVILNYDKLKFITYTVPVNFVMGFRINVKPPKFYRWFMNTKLYSWM